MDTNHHSNKCPPQGDGRHLDNLNTHCFVHEPIQVTTPAVFSEKALLAHIEP